jgi:hypothetical protein
MTRFALRFNAAADPTWAGRTWPGTFTTRTQAEQFLNATHNKRHLEVIEVHE